MGPYLPETHSYRIMNKSLIFDVEAHRASKESRPKGPGFAFAPWKGAS